MTPDLIFNLFWMAALIIIMIVYMVMVWGDSKNKHRRRYDD